MFDECGNGSAWSNSQRGWTTLLSFAVQAFTVAALLLIPLLSIQGMPSLTLIVALSAPTPPPAPPPVVQPHDKGLLTSNMFGRTLMMPTRIPHDIANVNESDLPPAPDLAGETGVPGGTGRPGAGNSVLFGLGAGTNPIPILSPPLAVRPVRISHMMEGNLIYRVQPEYPQLARQARIQGTVVLRAIIGRDGGIENLQVVSGHPLLVQAALDAVRQWHYRPYLLNEQPVEVETQITVNFMLSGG